MGLCLSFKVMSSGIAPSVQWMVHFDDKVNYRLCNVMYRSCIAVQMCNKSRKESMGLFIMEAISIWTFVTNGMNIADWGQCLQMSFCVDQCFHLMFFSFCLKKNRPFFILLVCDVTFVTFKHTFNTDQYMFQIFIQIWEKFSNWFLHVWKGYEIPIVIKFSTV